MVFNRAFDRATRAYGKALGGCLRKSAIVLLIYVGLLGLTAFGMARIPAGFVPIARLTTVVLSELTMLPNASSNSTRTAGVMTWPATVLLGPVRKSMCVAVAGEIVKLLDVSCVSDGADSFLIEDGRIVAQTIHYTVDER